MTREESTAKLVQLRSEAEALVKTYNEAIQGGNYEDATKADNAISEKVNEYTATVRDMCFEDCKNSDDPMMAAVKTLTFVTIGTKDEKKGDDKVPVRSIIDKERQIDLHKLHKYCGSIGANENWEHIAQKMNFLLTAQKCVDLGIDPKAVNDSYSMSEIAREFDMGKNPTSKTNLLRTLQTVITAMLGDGYKATSHDVNYLMSVYSRKNRKALTVTCANHKFFRNYLAEVCHRIVTPGAVYEVDFRSKKSN
ncbi:hypothetical protein [Flavonifractor plautii]|uniref:hypothetical protein n=1 Tax=Flavonifractor plautii TaxID=292800 RepID=UPI0018AA4FB5|nr:hypothetical protein [Flavonifractor plautii]